MKIVILFVFLFLISMTGKGIYHSGGTDEAGCHYDHSTGIYHCH